MIILLFYFYYLFNISNINDYRLMVDHQSSKLSVRVQISVVVFPFNFMNYGLLYKDK